MLPLVAALGLMGLMGSGSSAVNWFSRKQAADDAAASSSRIGDLLGTAPGLMYPGGGDQAGPPEQTPGTGLMADPADPRRQLQFAQGLMALQPGERTAAGSLFGDILARAQQQAAQSATLAEHTREFGISTDQAQAQHDAKMKLAQDQFAWDKQLGGEKWALEQLQRRQALAKGALEMQLEQIKINQAQQPDSGVQLGPVPADHMRVLTPQGLVTMPVPGSDPFNKEKDTQQNLSDLHGTISELDNLVKVHGTEAWDAKTVGRMQFLYGKAVSGLAALEGGNVSKEKLKEMHDMIGDPAGWSNVFKSNEKLHAGYDEAKKSVIQELAKARARTAGWIGFDSPLAARPGAGAGGIPPLPPGAVLRRPGASGGF